MPTLELDGRLIYFAHCPKAGGTSVERFMVERWGSAVGLLGWGWDRRWSGRGERRGEVPCSPQHLVWADARRLLPRAPDHVFTVVRDPAARLLSEYRYQRTGRLTGPIGRPLRGLSFPIWLRLMFAMADLNPYTHDNHFRAQSEFMPREDVTVFRLEDGLGPVLAWLCALVGAAPPATPPHDLRCGASARVEIAPEDRSLIAARYRGDYTRFGYARPEDPERQEAERGSTLVRAAARALDPFYRWGHI